MSELLELTTQLNVMPFYTPSHCRKGEESPEYAPECIIVPSLKYNKGIFKNNFLFVYLGIFFNVSRSLLN